MTGTRPAPASFAARAVPRALGLALVLATLPVIPRASAAQHPTRLRAELRLASLYDSNILEYSDADRDAFRARDPASRFAIESLDDAVFSGTASVSISRRVVGARPSRLRYAFTRAAFVENPIEDSRLHAVSLRQPLRRTGWVEVGYSRVPRSYVRHLWDEDFVTPYRYYPHYQAALYRSDRVRISGGFRAAAAWAVSGRVARTAIDYSAAFEERDATAWEVAAACARGREGAGAGSVALEASYTHRDAEATDTAHPAVPDSLRDDTSFDEWGLAVEAIAPPGRLRGLPIECDARVEISRRRYTTDREADIDHHGRRDVALVLGLDVEREIRRGIAVFGTWRFDSRNASGVAAAGPRAEVSDYTETRVGGGVRLSWSRRAP